MSFISLPTCKLYKKPGKIKLKNFPAGYVGRFCWNLPNNIGNFLGSDFYGKIASDKNIPTEYVPKYILATSDFGKGMQTDINNYLTRDSINNAGFRQKLDPIKNNLLKRQNPLELVFEYISTFDAENSIVGSLLRELDSSKKLMAGDLVKKAPGPPGVDFAIRNRLNKLKERKSNTSLPPTPLLPPFLPPPPPLPTLPSPFLFPSPPPPPPPPINHLFPPQLPLPPPSSSFRFPTQLTFPSNNLFSSQTQALTREKEETKNEESLNDNKIYELPEMPKTELGDRLANLLGTEGEKILEDDFLWVKELKDKNIEEIKEDYKFDKIKNAFDEGTTSPQLKYFLWWGTIARKI